MDLLTKIDEYKALLDKKEDLAQEVKDNNAAIAALKKEISTMMIDEECPKISRSGYTYSLQNKVIYSKKSDAELSETGVDFLETLRAEGFADLIVEKVDPRTLSSALKNVVEEEGCLPDGLADVINVYEEYDISKRVENNRNAAKAASK